MQRWVIQWTGSFFVMLLFAVSVERMIAYHQSKYLANIDASLSGLCFFAAMASLIFLVFNWPNSRLYHLWLALTALGFAFALAYCLIEESFFRPYPNLIESGNRRIIYGCLGVVVFSSICGSILWRYRARKLGASQIVKLPVLQGFWAILAWVLSFLVMATVNDSIHPINNYDVRWLVIGSTFLILFVIPWVRIWIREAGKTPTIFDASVVFLVGFLTGEVIIFSRSHYRPLSSYLDDIGNWELIYIPFLLVAYLALRWSSGKRFYFPIAVTLGAMLAAAIFVMQAGICD